MEELKLILIEFDAFTSRVQFLNWIAEELEYLNIKNDKQRKNLIQKAKNLPLI